MKNLQHKFKWGGIHPFSYHTFVFHNVPVLENKTVVDCGCGRGVWGFLMRTTRDFGKKGKLIGIDLQKEYLDFCKNYNIYDKLIKTDITKLPLKDKSVDFLICSEVIEHLNKKKGKKFLNEVDRVIKVGGRAIITTPNVHTDTVIDAGPDSHDSLWSASDFRNNGYKVRGLGIRLPITFHKWYSVPVLALGYIFTPVSYIFPELGSLLIATKEY